MAENLSRVIQRINQSKKSVIPEIKEEEVEEMNEEDEIVDDEDIEEEEIEEKPIKKKKIIKKTEKPIEKTEEVGEVTEDAEIQEKRAMEVEILQNDGVYRVEMLYQLGQINQSLLVLNSLINKAIGEEDAKK